MTRSKTFRLVGAALVSSVALGAPAAAQTAGDSPIHDRAYRHRPEHPVILQELDRRPLWSVAAQCGGFLGAVHNQYMEWGQGQTAEAARARGVALVSLAVRALRADRRLPRSDALAIASTQVDQGRAQAQALAARGASPSSTWNMTRSRCMDLAETVAMR